MPEPLTFVCPQCGTTNNFDRATQQRALGRMVCGHCGAQTLVTLPDQAPVELLKAQERQKENRVLWGCGTVIALGIVLGLISYAVSGTGDETPTDPFEQMELAFDGNPPRSEIQPRLDAALDLYRTPKTEENYSRAGSTLVALRQELGHSELSILDQMICMNVNAALGPDNAGMDFPEGAALAASALSIGDVCVP